MNNEEQSFSKNFETLSRISQEISSLAIDDKVAPDIDQLLIKAKEAKQAYIACKKRIDQVRQELEIEMKEVDLESNPKHS
jgi:hypothetical protein